MKSCLLLFFLVLLSCTPSISQAPSSAHLKVFLDCSAGCDETFIKSEITIVDFVLDRLAADVHLLITSQTNGSGGSTVQLAFFGQHGFKDRSGKITCDISPNATSVERRAAITHRIKLGLIPFMNNGPAAAAIQIDMKSADPATNKTSANRTADRWNYWVFRAGIDGSFNAEQVYQNTTASGSLSANRTTDGLRFNLSAWGNYNTATYSYDNKGKTETYEVINSDYLFSHYLVKSLSQHWSLGYEASYSNSTFSNNKGRIYFSPAVEFAIFPYKEVNEKFFTISYGPEIRHNTYYDTTIYNQTSELLTGQKLKANLSLRQKWGSVTTAINYSNFFKDWHLNNLSASLNVDIRITGGLSFYLYTSGGLVHDQVYLVRGDATEQEILTRRRQLASSYTFYSGLGISFRFGSILNNFVNPRFPNY